MNADRRKLQLIEVTSRTIFLVQQQVDQRHSQDTRAIDLPFIMYSNQSIHGRLPRRGFMGLACREREGLRLLTTLMSKSSGIDLAKSQEPSRQPVLAQDCPMHAGRAMKSLYHIADLGWQERYRPDARSQSQHHPPYSMRLTTSTQPSKLVSVTRPGVLRERLDIACGYHRVLLLSEGEMLTRKSLGESK